MIHLLNIALAVTLTILTLVMASAQGGYGYHDGQRRRTREEMVMKSDLSVDQAALAQSDAEPVAWRWRDNRYSVEQYGGRWQGPTADPNEARWRSNLIITINDVDSSQYTVEPLYTAPPCPDASAGLIEAAEMAEDHATKYCYDSQAEQGLLRNFAQLLRARTAERSGK